jgi:hypothetical protein
VSCGVLGLALLVGLTVVASRAEDDKSPSIKEIMTKAHKGGDSLLQKLGKELKADAPQWDDIEKQTKELVDLGTALAKNKPPRGTQESWDKQTRDYLSNAQDLAAAAAKKDKATALADLKKLQGSCMECHTAHKGKGKP